MPAYQTPSARVFDCLRNAGVFVLLLLVLKSFLSADVIPTRQATVDAKGLRAPYLESVSTADNSVPPETSPVVLSPQEQNQYDETNVDDDDDDGVIDTGAVLIDGDDDDQAIATSSEPVTLSLHLIGERHSGTKWMSAHLQKCFSNVRFTNNPFRWKHWFQDDSIHKFGNERFVVVAQFRNPYTWTEAMRTFPHHAPLHFHLDWPEFVTRKWTMPRYAEDLEFMGWTADTSRNAEVKACESGEFLPHQVIPCNANRRAVSTRGIGMMALYELRNDGSGKPYDNILDMRREKIENFLNVADFERVQDVYVVRYEEAKLFGTKKLIEQLEEALGQKASCSPVQGDKNFRERKIPKMFRGYLKTHVHWETEAKIGYFPEDSY